MERHDKEWVCVKMLDELVMSYYIESSLELDL